MTDPENLDELVDENVRLRGELDIAAKRADIHARTIAHLEEKVSALKKTIRSCRTQITNIKDQRDELRGMLFSRNLREVNAKRGPASVNANGGVR
ncbi:hypothetical protein [Nocardia sp. NPDC046763]|uniref:hypothetical protein n=1 Tax=Nocardia sp. NPDC046763 TaxID=3155256 RepID=UPI0033CCBEE2